MAFAAVKLHAEGAFFMVTDTSTSKTKRTLTDEQRARNAAYLREYRLHNPDKVRKWRDNYVLRRAARLQAEGLGGADGAGD